MYRRKSNILIIIQARTASARLPNKVMLQAVKKPLLSLMIERVEYSHYSQNLVVATTTNTEDDVIEQLCNKEHVNCFRGHPTDLLDRHYKASLAHGADHVVKIPSDCPLIDPDIIDRVITHYIEKYPDLDYVSNLHPPSYPDGNDVEIFSFLALQKAWEESRRDYEREHTTPYMWDNPEKFNTGNISWGNGLDYSMTHRWTLDYPADYEFVKSVYEELYERDPYFGLNEILNLLIRKPHLNKINDKYIGISWYRNHPGQLKTLDKNYAESISNI